MLLVCQFPICDARPFAGGSATRLVVPSWPDPVLPSFVRSFGRVGRRLCGGHPAFKDEAFYASAHHAFRFDRLEIRALTDAVAGLRTACAFRRLHCDGMATVRVEVGLAVTRLPQPLSGGQALSLTTGLFTLPVVVRGADGAPAGERFDALGSHLAKLYAAATTPLKAAPPVLQPHLVCPGEMLVLLEHEPGDVHTFPKHARELDTGMEGVRLAFLWYTRGNRESGIWFLQGPPKDSRVRRLRLGLMRLHAEHQVLKQVLSFVKNKTLKYVRRSEGSNLLDTYLDRVTRLVSGGQGSSETDAAIREVFHAYDALANPDELALLSEALGEVRRQIRRNFMDYLDSTTAGAAMPPIKVFISYSHQDKKYLKSLLAYLAGMEKTDNVTFWHDERLLAGELWDDVLHQQMGEADVALVLVSQDFLNSKYCQEVEVETFLGARRDAGLVVLPIILSDCDWRSHAWLKETQFLPPDGAVLASFHARKARRDGFYLTVLNQLREHAKRIRAGAGA